MLAYDEPPGRRDADMIHEQQESLLWSPNIRVNPTRRRSPRNAKSAQRKQTLRPDKRQLLVKGVLVRTYLILANVLATIALVVIGLESEWNHDLSVARSDTTISDTIRWFIWSFTIVNILQVLEQHKFFLSFRSSGEHSVWDTCLVVELFLCCLHAPPKAIYGIRTEFNLLVFLRVYHLLRVLQFSSLYETKWKLNKLTEKRMRAKKDSHGRSKSTRPNPPLASNLMNESLPDELDEQWQSRSESRDRDSGMPKEPESIALNTRGRAAHRAEESMEITHCGASCYLPVCLRRRNGKTNSSSMMINIPGVVKLYVHVYPFIFVTTLTLAFYFFLSYSIFILEREDMPAKFTWNGSLFFTFLTMTTVGYHVDQVQDLSRAGMMLSFADSAIGMSLLMLSVFSAWEKLQLSTLDKKAVAAYAKGEEPKVNGDEEERLFRAGPVKSSSLSQLGIERGNSISSMSLDRRSSYSQRRGSASASGGAMDHRRRDGRNWGGHDGHGRSIDKVINSSRDRKDLGKHQRRPSGSGSNYGSSSRHSARPPTSSGPEQSYTSADGQLILSEQLPLLNARYQVEALVGRGTFSQLVRAHDLQDNQKVALKVMNAKYAYIGIQEAAKVSQLNLADPTDEGYVVRFTGNFYFQRHFVIVMELLDASLLSHMKIYEDRSVPLPLIRSLSLQLVSAFVHLRNHRVIHADIKPENILLTGRQERNAHVNQAPKIKLIDFGNAVSDRDVSVYFDDFRLQTVYYRAPEVVMGVPFSFPVDMWSLGCVIVELRIGRPLFMCRNNQELFYSMLQLLGPFPETPYRDAKFYNRYFGRSRYMAKEADASLKLNNLAKLLHSHDPEFVTFVGALLEYNPARRLTPRDAIFHPFFAPIFPFSLMLDQPANLPSSSAVRSHISAPPGPRSSSSSSSSSSSKSSKSSKSTSPSSSAPPSGSVPVQRSLQPVQPNHQSASDASSQGPVRLVPVRSSQQHGMASGPGPLPVALSELAPPAAPTGRSMPVSLSKPVPTLTTVGGKKVASPSWSARAVAR